MISPTTADLRSPEPIATATHRAVFSTHAPGPAISSFDASPTESAGSINIAGISSGTWYECATAST